MIKIGGYELNSEFIGVYLHIPFCVSKCGYCDFYSIVADATLMDSYTDALCTAIRNNPYRKLQADSLYFGGGTPILLGAKRIEKILTAVHDTFDMLSPEITMETNPYSTIKETLYDLHKMGINRLSIGLQSAVDKQLMMLSRNHTASEAAKCVADAIRVGFNNISLDIMLGVPTQSLDDVKNTIDFCASQEVTHISAYILKVEKGTPFDAMYSDNDFDEDLLADMYLSAVDRLAGHGYEQYEVSNFAKKGYQSVHNLHYWNSDNYIGIGPAAHSFMNNERFYFPRDIHGFIGAKNVFDTTIKDDEGGTFEEYAMLKLRLNSGLNLDEAEKLYNASKVELLQKAKKLPKELLNISDNNISLTRQGFLLSNTVISDLIF